MSLRVNMLLYFKYFKHLQTDELVEVVCSQNEKLATFKESILESINFNTIFTSETEKFDKVLKNITFDFCNGVYTFKFSQCPQCS